jgi:hypothetical protein
VIPTVCHTDLWKGGISGLGTRRSMGCVQLERKYNIIQHMLEIRPLTETRAQTDMVHSRVLVALVLCSYASFVSSFSCAPLHHVSRRSLSTNGLLRGPPAVRFFRPGIFFLPMAETRQRSLHPAACLLHAKDIMYCKVAAPSSMPFACKRHVLHYWAVV